MPDPATQPPAAPQPQPPLDFSDASKFGLTVSKSEPSAPMNPEAPDAFAQSRRENQLMIPHELRGYTADELAQPGIYINSRASLPGNTGSPLERLLSPSIARSTVGSDLKPMPVLDDPMLGGERMAEGVEQMAQPAKADKLRGAGKILTGATQAAAPVMLAIGVTAPIEAAAWYAGSKAAGLLTQAGAQKAGLNQEDAQEAGDVVQALPMLYGFGKMGIENHAEITNQAAQRWQALGDDLQRARAEAGAGGDPMAVTLKGPDGPRAAQVVHAGVDANGRPYQSVILNGSGERVFTGTQGAVLEWLGQRAADPNWLERLKSGQGSDAGPEGPQPYGTGQAPIVEQQNIEQGGGTRPGGYSIDPATGKLSAVPGDSPLVTGIGKVAETLHVPEEAAPAPVETSTPAPVEPAPEPAGDPVALRARLAEINDKIIASGGAQITPAELSERHDLKVQLARLGEPTYVEGEEAGQRPAEAAARVGTSEPPAETPAAQQPTQPTAAAPAVQAAPRGVVELQTDQVHADPVRFQFKADTGGKSGTGDELKSVQTFDPDLAGVIGVWYDPSDGKTYVVNGHHRLELAQRTGAETISGRYIDADNAGKARETGALINIAEGRGTAIDAAKVFRESNLTPEGLAARGVSLTGAVARNGSALAQLDPQIFNRVVQGDLPVERAAILGERLPEHQEQRAALALIDKSEARGKRPTNSEVGELIDFVKGAPVEDVDHTQTNLFGEEEIQQNAAWEKAEISDYIRKRIDQEVRLFTTASKGRTAEELGRAGNVIKTEENARIASEATQAQAIYDKLKTSAGPVNDVLDQSARELAHGHNATQIKAAAYDQIRHILPTVLSGRADTGAGANDSRSKGASESGPGAAGLPAGVEAEEAGGPLEHSGRLLASRSLREEPFEPSATNEELAGRMDFEHRPASADSPAVLHITPHVAELLARLTSDKRFEGALMDSRDLAKIRPGLLKLITSPKLNIAGRDKVLKLLRAIRDSVDHENYLVVIEHPNAEREEFAHYATVPVLAKAPLKVRADLADHPAVQKASEHLKQSGYVGPNQKTAALYEVIAKVGIASEWPTLGLDRAEALAAAAHIRQTLAAYYGEARAEAMTKWWEPSIRKEAHDYVSPPSGRTPASELSGHPAGAGRGTESGAGSTEEEEGGNGGIIRSARRPDDDRERSLFDSRTNEQVASESAQDRDQLTGDRLTAQLNAPLTREEQLKKLKASKSKPQSSLFEDNSDPQGSLFLGSGLGALQPYYERHVASKLAAGATQVAEALALAKDDILKVAAPAARGDAAESTSLTVRKNAAELQRSTDRAEAALRIAARFFDSLPEEERLDFMDHIEHGEKQETPELEQIASTMRVMLDSRREAIRELGTGKLSRFIENYFPHLWKKPELAKELSANWGKRPIEGSKGFLKKRSIETIADGIKAGLEPISTNPVELVLLKCREMDKYLMAHHILADLKKQGLLTYVDAREGQAPAGWQKIEDPVATVYGQSIQPITEYPNAGLWDGLTKVQQALGLTHERGFQPMGEAIGRAYQDKNHIATKHGTAEDVVAHEIGHQIDWLAGSGKRFVLEYPDAQTVNRLRQARKTLREKGSSKDARQAAREELANLDAAIQDRKAFAKELRDLADLRSGPKEYVRSRQEKMAQLAEMWVGAREQFERTAPKVFKLWKQFLDENPKLHALRDIEGNTEVHPISQPYDVGGVVIRGHWWAPEPAARILNHHLSPSLRDNSALVRGFFSVSNLLNQAQLGFSGFHAIFTGLEAVTSKLALGIYQAAHGDVGKGLKSAALAPLATVTTLRRGSKMLDEWYHPGTQGPLIGQLIDAAVQSGGRAHMETFYRTHIAKKMMQSWREGKIWGAVWRAPFAAFEAPTQLIMGELVPRLKMGAFADMAEYELSRLPAGATIADADKAMAKAWDSVDNRFGQLVYDNLFWHKYTKDVAMLLVRSPGWNVGDIRELGGGYADSARFAIAAAKKLGGSGTSGDGGGDGGGPDFTPRMSYIPAHLLVAATVGALLYYFWHGKAPRHLIDYFFPPDAHGKRWSPATYVKDEYNWAHDPVHTAANKVNPLLSFAKGVLSNRDWRDKPIRNPHHSFPKEVEELALYVVRTFEPIWLQQWFDKHGAKSADQRILPELGITPAPRSLDQHTR